jgi:hypothetical protein
MLPVSCCRTAKLLTKPRTKIALSLGVCVDVGLWKLKYGKG